jgi:hypothetical protein
MQGAQPGMRALPDQRPLPVSGKDMLSIAEPFP